LDVLDLSLNGLGETGLAAITRARWTAPAALVLDVCGLGDAGAAMLAGWPGLSRVRRLSLRDNEIGSAGLAALAASPHATALEALDLGGNRPAGMTALLRSPLVLCHS
jgi:hypothetical protein